MSTGILNIWKHSLAYYRSSINAIVVALLLDIAGIALNLLSPWPIKLIVDGIISQNASRNTAASRAFLDAFLGFASSQQQVMLLCIAMVAISAVSGLIYYKAAAISLKVGLDAVVRLRTHLYEVMHYLPFHYHDAVRISDSTFRVAYDTQAIQTLYNGVFGPTVTATVTLAGAFIIMLRLNPLLCLVAVAVIPPVVITIRLYAGKINKLSHSRNESESSLLGIVQEGLSAIKQVRVNVRESYEIERFSRSASDSKNASYRLTRVQLKSGFLIGLLTASGTASLYYVGATQVLANKLTLGGILVFVAYLSQLYSPIETLSGTIGTYSSAMAGVERSFGVIDRLEESVSRPGGRKLCVTRGSIQVSNLCFAYPDGTSVFNDVSIDIHPGETLALLGKTGEGKSTLLSLVCGFYDPHSGMISIDGQDLSQCDQKSVRSSLSIVLQDTVLFSASIYENIRYGNPTAHPADVYEAARRAEALAFIERLPNGFDTQVGERGARLSGGQRQRIAIARAFLRNAPILLLDEPTSSLDPITEEKIIHTLFSLMQKRTTLLITHRMSLAQMADKVAILSGGKIIEYGVPSALLLTAGHFSKLVKAGDQKAGA